MSETVDIRSLWDAAVVGQEPPPPHGGAPCADQHPTRLYVCSRLVLHAGQHVTIAPALRRNGSLEVAATWPQEVGS